MDQYARALKMLQKLVAESDALCSPIDQSRNVRDYKRFSVGHFNNTELRTQGRERIIGDFGTRVGNMGKKG